MILSTFARSSGFNELLGVYLDLAFQSAGDEGASPLSEVVTSLTEKTIKPTTDTMKLAQQGCLKQGVNEVIGSEEVDSP